ncbi:CCA tRNA nucleotidyltransferase [Sphingomonas lutea]|uniref:CCA tRNA nucleotidyltransferase n=1 Tax=Sphingomonas lutea TaxID=1045317 RepID=A0A7G9SKL3_9SPHN|nr:CCA tRNA nucleotidyltransferase [Sphingomonas lutea]QNN68388.1 CCA tRNA nucleotidyltransferase [Sphingomonas lutea]
MTLDAAKWRKRRGMQRLFDALGADEGLTRFVGGAVRDDLLGLPVSDVDLATRLKPEEVVARLEAARIKAVPTGIAHGTVTAVSDGHPVEITTLRRDVSTDGRRATVAFTDDWKEDAARRDFTINALSADPLTGQIHDYFGGLDDLKARRIRFIGDPLQRIAEDHLRILRFFRFHARFGATEPDGPALDACTARANDLMALSRERIADELMKLLGLPNPAPTLAIMLDRAILRPVLPEIDPARIADLRALIAAEQSAAVVPDALRRLAALLPRDPGLADKIGGRLRLSNKARKRLVCAAERDLGSAPRVLAYRVGSDCAIDRLLLAGDSAAAASLAGWKAPRLPTSGGALIARGLREGPLVATTLKQIEERWIEAGFPTGALFAEIVDSEVAAALSKP